MNWQEKYIKYIQSLEWQHKRRARLKIDGFRCRTCWSEEELECHHLTYDRLGNEDIDDLIILCKYCHEAITNSIRERRYRGREIDFTNETERELNYVATDRSKIDWSKRITNAQRSIGRPPERVNERDEKDLWKAEEDRQRFRGTGDA